MGEIDFEAEARAWLNMKPSPADGGVGETFDLEAGLSVPMFDLIVMKLREVDARARAEGKAEGYRLGVEAATAPLRGMKTNERTGYMAAIPQTKELCAYTALILLECIGRIRALARP